MPSKTRKFFISGLSLTVTALLMRGIAMLFGVYVSNRAGSEAVGLYSLLGSIYAFSITLATAGINLSTTRLVSDALGLDDPHMAKTVAKRALAVCTVSGIISSVLLFSLSEPLALRFLGDVRAILPLRILSFTLTPIAICSCLSGYFNAVRRVKINAAFQVVAQLVKIAATVYFLSLLLDKGTEQACIALVLGGAVAEFFSMILSLLLYLYDRKKLIGERKNISSGITLELLKISIPVTVSACIRSALSMLQHVLIPKGLKASGKSWASALSSYGALHGMAMPLVLFPSAFIGAFAGLLIPEISECCIQNNSERLRRVAYRTLSLSLFFSIGVSGIMLFYSEPLGLMVYKSSETAHYIRIMAPLIPVMYIDSAVDAILKGSGHQVYSMNVNIADTLSACIFALTLIPRMGIMGYVISIYATEILNTTLSIAKMISVCGIRPRIFHQVIMPIVCIIGATNGVSLISRLLNFSFNGGFNPAIHISMTSFIYVALLFITKTVGKEEKEFLSASLLSEKKYGQKHKYPVG